MTKSNKTELLQARVTPQVHEAVAKLAEKYDVHLCQIIRWALAAYIEREVTDEE